MMTVVLRHCGTTVEEVDAGHEILHPPILANPLAVLCEVPAGQLLELLPGLVDRARVDAPLARLALLPGQFGRRLDGHERASAGRSRITGAPSKELFTVASH